MHLSQKVPAWVPMALLVFYLVAGSLIFAFWEGWSYVDGAYFSFITFTTIGFGDLVPGEGILDNRNGRSLLCATYLLFGVMLTAMSFELIQEDIYEVKTRLLQWLGVDQINLPRANSKWSRLADCGALSSSRSSREKQNRGDCFFSLLVGFVAINGHSYSVYPQSGDEERERKEKQKDGWRVEWGRKTRRRKNRRKKKKRKICGE